MSVFGTQSRCIQPSTKGNWEEKVPSFLETTGKRGQSGTHTPDEKWEHSTLKELNRLLKIVVKEYVMWQEMGLERQVGTRSSGPCMSCCLETFNSKRDLQKSYWLELCLIRITCLENPMDKGAWQAMVHRVAESRTQLKPLSTHTHTTTAKKADHRKARPEAERHYEVVRVIQ